MRVRQDGGVGEWRAYLITKGKLFGERISDSWRLQTEKEKRD